MPRAQIGLPQIIQLLFSASFIGTSAYLSYTLNECSCNHGRIFVPNQIVMIMGVLGVAFTLCNCCFDKILFGHYLNTVVPALVVGVCTIVMATGESKCDKCKTTNKTCCVNFKNPAIRIQSAVGVILLIWGLVAYSAKDASPYKKAEPKKTQADWQTALQAAVLEKVAK